MSTNSLTFASATGITSDRDAADVQKYDDLLSMARIAWLYSDDDTAGDKLADKARRLAHRLVDRGVYDPILDQLERAYA